MGRGLSVEAINARLKAANIRVTVLQRGNALYLQATLPPKPGETRSKQRQLALGVPSSVDGLRVAEARAFELASQLTLGTFQWAKWLGDEASDKQIIKDAIAAFEKDYKARNSLSDESWRHFWHRYLKLLPPDTELTEAIVIATVQATEPNTWHRDQVCKKIGAFCKWAGVTVNLAPYRGKFKKREIIPPTKEETEAGYELVKSCAWKIIYARIAIFGLRPHEAFYFERRGSVEGYVTEGKTGAREVFAVFPQWLDQWAIEGELPRVTWNSYQMLGNKIGRQYRHYGLEFSPYDYRHAAAIEYSVVRGAPLKLAALQFGHSEQIHLGTYTRWLNSANMREAYDRIMGRD